MPSSEKFCLKWNDFQENVSTAFKSLRNDKDFTDVTLASEGGHQLEAHKVILSAASPFFQNILRRNKHEHPLIFMRGLKSDDLVAVVDFLYFGEVKIYQENLDTFLTIAEELSLKGMNGGVKGDYADVTQPLQETFDHKTNLKTTESLTKIDNRKSLVPELQIEDMETIDMVIPPKQMFSGNLQELDDKLDSMMTRGENIIPDGSNTTKASICKVCGKEGKKSNIKNHIESIHLEGISIPCFHCERKFRTRRSLWEHRMSLKN